MNCTHSDDMSHAAKLYFVLEKTCLVFHIILLRIAIMSAIPYSLNVKAITSMYDCLSMLGDYTTVHFMSVYISSVDTSFVFSTTCM